MTVRACGLSFEPCNGVGGIDCLSQPTTAVTVETQRGTTGSSPTASRTDSPPASKQADNPPRALHDHECILGPALQAKCVVLECLRHEGGLHADGALLCLLIEASVPSRASIVWYCSFFRHSQEQHDAGPTTPCLLNKVFEINVEGQRIVASPLALAAACGCINALSYFLSPDFPGLDVNLDTSLDIPPAQAQGPRLLGTSALNMAVKTQQLQCFLLILADDRISLACLRSTLGALNRSILSSTSSAYNNAAIAAPIIPLPSPTLTRTNSLLHSLPEHPPLSPFLRPLRRSVGSPGALSLSGQGPYAQWESMSMLLMRRIQEVAEAQSPSETSSSSSDNSSGCPSADSCKEAPLTPSTPCTDLDRGHGHGHGSDGPDEEDQEREPEQHHRSAHFRDPDDISDSGSTSTHGNKEGDCGSDAGSSSNGSPDGAFSHLEISRSSDGDGDSPTSLHGLSPPPSPMPSPPSLDFTYFPNPSSGTSDPSSRERGLEGVEGGTELGGSAEKLRHGGGGGNLNRSARSLSAVSAGSAASDSTATVSSQASTIYTLGQPDLNPRPLLAPPPRGCL